MKKKIIYVSGVLNFETIVDVDSFPIFYCPVEYPFFGINSTVGGQAYNIAKALTTLGGNKVILGGEVGNDLLGKVVIDEINKLGIDASSVDTKLEQTPTSAIFVDRDCNTKIYNDLKDLQDVKKDIKKEIKNLKASDLVVLSNTNFNREILLKAKELGKKVASDVHIVGSTDDEFNQDFMKYSDILFLSKKGLNNYKYEDFLLEIYNKYHNEIIVLGEGREGAMVLIAKEKVIYHIDAITLRTIVNTVGSRDALFSAFLHYYLRRRNPLKALELAEVFTSIKIGEMGGSNGFVNAKVVNKQFKDVDFDVYKIKQF